MDLFCNDNPTFTKHVVAKRLLNEPFVVVDIGVLGGENPRWGFLGEYLVFHGFDANESAIAELDRKRAPGRSYHAIAIGDRDGEGYFYFNPENPSSSSFVPAGDSRFEGATAAYEKRRVRIRSLDSLVAENRIPAPDFLKVDVESFEAAVLGGGANCIATRLFGIEIETNFNVGPDYPQTHLGTLQSMLLPDGFRLFDLDYDRTARAAYLEGRRRAGMPPVADGIVGRPDTFNVLFCQDMIAEAELARVYPRRRHADSLDQIIKQVIIFELYGLVDIAYDTVARFDYLIRPRIDPDEARQLLLDSSGRFPGTPYTMAAELARIEQENARLRQSNERLRKRIGELRDSTSWRITAPLRLTKRFLSSGRWKDDSIPDDRL